MYNKDNEFIGAFSMEQNEPVFNENATQDNANTYIPPIKKSKKDKVFSIIGVLLFISFFLIAILASDSLLSPLLLGFFAVFYLTVLINGLIMYPDKRRKILSCLITIGNGFVFLLRLFIPGNIMLFSLFIYNTLLTLYFILYYFVYKTKYPNGNMANLNKYSVFAMIFPVYLCVIWLTTNTTLNDARFFTYFVIIAVILSAVFLILSLTVYRRTYLVLTQKIATRVCSVICAILFIFLYSFLLTSAINVGLPSEKHTATYEIVDKQIHSSDSSTDYTLYIIFDGNKIDIDVSSDLYHEKEIGDALIVDYYSGALNIPYLTSGE